MTYWEIERKIPAKYFVTFHIDSELLIYLGFALKTSDFVLRFKLHYFGLSNICLLL